MEKFSPLEAISPIDGRNRHITESLAAYFSWQAQTRYQIWVELEYLGALSRELGQPLNDEELALTKQIPAQYSAQDAHRLWEIYRELRHDIKAVEVFLREKFRATPLEKRIPLLHFGLTSADIDNIAFKLALRDHLKEQYLPKIKKLNAELAALAESWKSLAMLGRTHGRPAVPTTLGKEIANFALRVRDREIALASARFFGKLTGAIGNFNAHTIAYPTINWPAFSQKFVIGLGLEPVIWTTQIPPYDDLIAVLDQLRLTNGILIGLARDIWSYISYGYLNLTSPPQEIGSSTMPQKINPVDFEAAEANFSSANALFENLSRLLPANRLQRDLTDKYLLRDIGSALAYSWIAFEALERGLARLQPNEMALRQDLNEHWEVLAEAVQSILRAKGYPDAYETVRHEIQGRALGRGDFMDFIYRLAAPPEIRQELARLTPESYLGKAVELTDEALRILRSAP